MVKDQESQENNQAIKTGKIDKRTLRPLKVSLADFMRITDNYLTKCQENGEVPFLGDVAILCGIDRHTLWEYKEKQGYGSRIKKIEQIGENMLFRTVANGKGVNANQMFLLKAKYGYSENQKIDITSNGKGLGVVMLPSRSK